MSAWEGLLVPPRAAARLLAASGHAVCDLVAVQVVMHEAAGWSLVVPRLASLEARLTAATARPYQLFQNQRRPLYVYSIAALASCE
jgi:hypothetical protein